MSLRRSLLAVRIVALLQAVLLVAQVALAGGFLGGHFNMLEMHGMLARGVVGVAVLMAVAAFLVRRAGGPSSFLGLSLLLLVALLGQVVLGVKHSVPAHVLLGVLIVAASAMFTQRVLSTPLPPGDSPEAPDRASELVA
ncbi:hypothetical protein [Streptomyces sp. CB01373]|uniref:hypothetical protein n=1 Tax=Streptomyces sp. CB01373 TaxID=2020325 RepID=UPI000C27A096|nr:hypothetical protein [Streptomyces sp. CB01373]PJM95407.1 hypothetical protein CG719_13100 [Streptomyces sp. CB01373]